MLVTKALSHDVTILAFVPLSLFPLESPSFIPYAFLSDKIGWIGGLNKQLNEVTTGIQYLRVDKKCKAISLFLFFL